MSRSALVVFSMLIPILAVAGEISDGDVATYALTRKDGQPIDMKMRLSRSNGNWVMEERTGDSPWKNISCDSGCEYRATTTAEGDAYLAAFPGEMQKRFDIACIQNVANAFCRLTKKDDPSKGGYALVALVTGRPVPLSLKRLTRPY